MEAAERSAPEAGAAPICRALNVPRASFYRWRKRKTAPPPERAPRPKPARALSDGERRAVLDALHSDRFADKAPATVRAQLLDEGAYLCSVKTMYRILEAEDEVRERRNQLRHPQYKKPKLVAAEPNRVWSWDIAKLLGPVKWTHYHLYVVLDIFSRFVVGWMVATRESAALAKRLIEESCRKQGVTPGSLAIHSDRGSSMKSKVVAQLLADLGVTKSHSRPHVSNDNPYSESQFKTLKYRPGFPERFGSIEDARAFCQAFFQWYNQEHRHSGIAYLTPANVHDGRAGEVVAKRQIALDAAYKAHPERFVKGPPKHPKLDGAVWINPPEKADSS